MGNYIGGNFGLDGWDITTYEIEVGTNYIGVYNIDTSGDGPDWDVVPTPTEKINYDTIYINDNFHHFLDDERINNMENLEKLLVFLEEHIANITAAIGDLPLAETTVEENEKLLRYHTEVIEVILVFKQELNNFTF